MIGERSTQVYLPALADLPDDDWRIPFQAAIEEEERERAQRLARHQVLLGIFTFAGVLTILVALGKLFT